MSLVRQTVFVLLVFVSICGTIAAQRPGPQFRRPLACEPLEPRTKLEAVEWRYERVVIKGFTQVAVFNARDIEIRVDAVELKDIDSPTRAIGLVIALRAPGDSPRENRAYVDYEEIDRLLKALDAIGKVNESVTRLASFEGRYRTLGDLEINVFRQSRSGTAATLSSGTCERVTGYLTLDELDRFKAHLVEAKNRLDEIR